MAQLDAYTRRILDDGQGAAAAEEFANLWRAFHGGTQRDDGCEGWTPLSPDEFPRLEDLHETGDRLEGVGWLILNGGLGTTMKMEHAKTLTRVRGEKTFLDLILESVRRLRARHGASLPVLFMNSYATDSDTKEALGKTPLDDLHSFCQHRFPRIDPATLEPFGSPEDPESWAPPGHGDLYSALAETSLPDEMLARGINHLFVSNGDNLGAWPDPKILSHIKRRGIEFLLELTPRTAADKKGGALLRRNGKLALMESAMLACADGRLSDECREGSAFNTNNAWFDLREMKRLAEGGRIRLPVFANPKTVRGREAIQLEHALGSAVSAFRNSSALIVPRERFAPVKNTEDLLARKSDLYEEGESAPLVPTAKGVLGQEPVRISLDPRYYASVADLERRIPCPPSLVAARELYIKGDVRFAGSITVKGSVAIENKGGEPLVIEQGTVLEG